MNIAFDFDGTITKNPFLFKSLIELLMPMYDIYIISGTAKKDQNKLLKELLNYNINIDLNNILLKDDYGDINNTTEWKYNIIDKYKIRLYFENRLDTAQKIQELCTVFHVL